MNLALLLFRLGLGLLPTIVLGIQTIQGDKVAGKTKLAMAQDELAIALQGASSVLVPGSTDDMLSKLAAASVAQVLGSTATITAIVNHTKATGQYAAATAVAVSNAAAVADATQTAAGK